MNEDLAGRIMAHAFNDELEKIAGVKRHGRIDKALNKRFPEGLPSFEDSTKADQKLLDDWSTSYNKLQRRVTQGTEPGSLARVKALARYSVKSGVSPASTGPGLVTGAARKSKPAWSRALSKIVR